MCVAKVTIGGSLGSSYYLPTDKAIELFNLLAEAVPATGVRYELEKLAPELKGQAVANEPGHYARGVVLELAPAMPLPHFDQEQRIAELKAAKETAEAIERAA